MKKYLVIVLILLGIILGLFYLILPTWTAIKPAWFGSEQGKRIVQQILESGTQDTPFTIHDDFTLELLDLELENPRVIIEDSDGGLLVSEPSISRISSINDDQRTTVIEDLNRPHGLALKGNQLFVAETGQVLVFDYDSKEKTVSNKRSLLDLPSGGRHWTRTLGIGPDSNLYITVGSSCNICREEDWRRLKMLRYVFETQELEVYASGIRNAVFFAWHPEADELYATEMGRDWLGDDLPPDELLKITAGSNYGFPYCYGNNIVDPEFNEPDNCVESEPSHYDFNAHESPLGIDFYNDDLIIALHGSWNRPEPVGYEVIRLHKDTDYQTRESIMSGFLLEDGTSIGRPAGILSHSDGSIYISDDKADILYRLIPS